MSKTAGLAGLVYLLYLLSRSRERVGRVTVLAAWGVAAGVIWFLAPSPALYLLLHIGLIWLVRSLYFYSSVLSVLADLGLNGLSLAMAVWAALQSGSVFLSLWSFFLVQALFVAIPPRLGPKAGERRPERDEEDRFQHAHRAAETALRKISSIR
ncbi:MAG: hypothetical protein U9Q71_00905 [Pseudomonadota bacterium]|nr:hypothetical protein [Pseudomonadota bacterium]